MDQNTVLIALTIDENLRTIAIPTNGVVFGVVGDVEVNRVQFVLPRYFRGFDLTEFTARVNYANPNGDANYYEADDITDTDGNCTFTWLMGSDVTAYVGDVTFSITLYKKEGDVVAHRFGTRTATGRVLEGYSVEESVTPAQQKTLVEKISEEVISNFKTDDVVAQVEKNSEASKKLQNIKMNALSKKTLEQCQFIDKKYRSINNDEYSSPTASYIIANIQPNTEYYITGTNVNEAYPLGIIVDDENNILDIVGGDKTSIDFEDTRIVTPPNSSKIYINSIKSQVSVSHSYPSIYKLSYDQSLTGSDIINEMMSKSTKNIKYQEIESVTRVLNTFMAFGGSSKDYKAYEDATSIASGYSYVSMLYNDEQTYYVTGECKTNIIPIVLCCDKDNRIIKVFGNNTGDVYITKKIDIPKNTYIVYVNGCQLKPGIYTATERNTCSLMAGKTGLFLGDSITQGNNVYISPKITPIFDYPSIVSELLGIRAYNGGLGGSNIGGSRPIDFKNIVDSMISGDYTTVINGINAYGLNKSAIVQYNKIQNMDFNSVDFICLAYGTNDLTADFTIQQITSNLEYGISQLLEHFPHISIYVISPIYRFNVLGKGADSDTYVNSEGKKLTDICDSICGVCEKYNIPFLNLYKICGINKYNKQLYMGDDTHPNKNGYRLIGTKIAKFINSF